MRAVILATAIFIASPAAYGAGTFPQGLPREAQATVPLPPAGGDGSITLREFISSQLTDISNRLDDLREAVKGIQNDQNAADRDFQRQYSALASRVTSLENIATPSQQAISEMRGLDGRVTALEVARTTTISNLNWLLAFGGAIAGVIGAWAVMNQRKPTPK